MPEEHLSGQDITDAVNEDPEEVAHLLESRQQARDGRRTPLVETMPAESRGTGWCAPSP